MHDLGELFMATIDLRRLNSNCLGHVPAKSSTRIPHRLYHQIYIRHPDSGAQGSALIAASDGSVS
jgi:hypothetical protein